jgi:hypothetical protein
MQSRLLEAVFGGRIGVLEEWGLIDPLLRAERCGGCRPAAHNGREFESMV